MRNNVKLNPRGTEKFAYQHAGEVTKLQKYFINIIETAFPNVKFKGNDSEEAYSFIGKYKKNVEHNKSTGDIYSVINGVRTYRGKYIETRELQFELSQGSPVF